MPHEISLSFPPSSEAPPLDDEALLKRRAARKLKVDPESLATVRALRISFDARRRERVWRVQVRAFEKGEEIPPPAVATPPTYSTPAKDARRVAIIGSGPAGLFCALDLLALGLHVTVFERGRDVQARRRSLRTLHRGGPADPDSNYCFGEGGAGTYSDGKLYTRSGNKRAIRGVLETLVAHGAPPDILVSWRPHVGSNRLPDVVKAMRDTITRSGGRVRFGQRVEEIVTQRSGDSCRVRGVRSRNLESNEESLHEADAVVLATGHSAFDALWMARRAGAELAPKGFSMGVRIEHNQSWVDDRQYGGLRGTHELPAAFYELASEEEGRGVYSFCMCPGGFIVPATTDPAGVVVNGMSLSRRDSPFANAGIVTSIEPEDWCGKEGERYGWNTLLAKASALGLPHDFPRQCPETPGDDPLFGARIQLALECVAAQAGGGANRAPVQRADIVASGRAPRSKGPGEALETSYRPGVTPTNLAQLLPPGMFERIQRSLDTFDRRMPGFASEHGQLLGVESRTSSPVRVVRDPETLASPTVAGLYPAGEGAGYAGGIISAALDGQRIAAALAQTAELGTRVPR